MAVKSVEFIDNSQEFSNDLDNAIDTWLKESTELVLSRATPFMRVDTSRTKKSYYTEVVNDGGVKCGYVGSDYYNALLEELGTGEFAKFGNGRKTPWKYKDANGQWHTTHGKTPTNALELGCKYSKNAIQSRLNSILGGLSHK